MPPTASRRPGRPPAAKADETRKRIVNAARQVFSEHGYDGATFQAIAVRADLTRPAINHYFSSKRVLYREVVNQTNELVVKAGIDRARDANTMMGRLSAFLSETLHAEAKLPATSAFLVTSVMESQRHPELTRDGNDPVGISREFLTWMVNDAIERGELVADTDVSTLTETLLMVLCGVGFYAGFLRTRHEMDAVTRSLQELLAGQLWRRDT
ncbi:TetR family transcriptional regulator [Mycobacterium sp. 852002-51163_SCH5372311]|uniref:TetR/AcrR family transcriptional regulator n=1 Tax=Mycobacterium sp. 852002-51163_SCH5372311 TaxID=1834097 RepID=UPI0007FCE84D|nr:TetR/AcrR family transcriptional regulator [Mycobacterium sp. 852002-51163_SCH5372311]OBF80049.1 TetR family transcriptional regulator [Mycobacterium sp. 852002-51163_SCH5372311]